MKRCVTCNKTKPLDEFVTPERSSCAICAPQKNPVYESNPDLAERIRVRARADYHNNKEVKRRKVVEYQRAKKIQAIEVLGSVCQRCGFDNPAALQFHHRDPSVKSFNITTKTLSTPRKFPWDVILKEIEKCDLLCANCHAVDHSSY